jgi:site-specific DNA recombinase
MCAKKRTIHRSGDRVAIYCRVSTQEQAEHGTSLESQREKCEEYATAKGWAIVAIAQE